MKRNTVTIIISVIIVAIISVGLLYNHFFRFSVEKWNKYPEMRVNMIDSLERKHKIVGKSEDEITALLGEAVVTKEGDCNKFEYYVGDSMKDPYTYNIIFKDGIAVSAGVVEH